MSSPGSYLSSSGKGAIIGIGGEVFGPLGAGAAGTLTSIGSDISHHQQIDYSKVIVTGALSYGGSKLSDSATKIPGRLPNIGSYSYYFGKHATQEVLKEAVGVGIDGIKSIFGGIINTNNK